MPTGEGVDVVRATRLGSRADDRPLPAAKGLAAHDGASDASVDVEVAGLDPFGPSSDLVGIERLQPGSEPVVAAVLDLDGVVEVVGADHPEHGAEALGAREP